MLSFSWLLFNQWHTVIYFQNFGSVTVLEVILLTYDFQAYRWSSQVSRISGKMKKANKGREGQTKARESTMPKFYDFFVSTGPFGVQLIRKNYKIQALLTLWPLFGLQDLFWPFSFLPKSLMPKKTSGVLESHKSALSPQNLLSDQISENRSLCNTANFHDLESEQSCAVQPQVN